MTGVWTVGWWALTAVVAWLVSVLVLRVTKTRWQGVRGLVETSAPNYRARAFEERDSSRPEAVSRCAAALLAWATFLLLGLVPLGRWLGVGFLDDVSWHARAHSLCVVWPLTVGGIDLAGRVAHAATRLARNVLAHDDARDLAFHLRVFGKLGFALPLPLFVSPSWAGLTLVAMSAVCLSSGWIARRLEETSVRQAKERARAERDELGPATDGDAPS